MSSHGGNMLVMAAVVTGLFAAEFLFGILPPVPRDTAGFRRLVDSPAFWGAFVGNIVAAIVVVAALTDPDEEPGSGGPR